MQERPPPQVTVSGTTGARTAEVLAAGSDDDGARSRWPALAGVALAALALVGVVLAQGERRSPQVAAPEDLALEETGGVLGLQWGYGGRLDVSLPLLVRNGGGPVTISSVALDGTGFAQPAVDVPVVPGGRLPLTLRQAMRCPEGAVVPPDAALRLDVRREGRAQTRSLPLPAGVADSLREALLLQCSAVPLEQAVVLRTEELGADAGVVELRVEADNIGSTGVQLLSVDAATGFEVTLAAAEPAALPAILSQEPVVLRLRVSVADCAAVPPVEDLAAAGIADVVYDDGRGSRAAEAVAGDLPALRALVERSC